MANIAVTTTNRVNVVESIIQMTLPAAEDIIGGDAVRIDATTGNFTKSNATTTTENRIYGIATKSTAAGLPVTAIRKGVLSGFTLAGNYDSVVYLSDTDGRIADSAGTVSTIIGRVISGTAEPLGTAHGKMLFVDL